MLSRKSFAACSRATGSSNRSTASAFPGGSGPLDGTATTSASSTGPSLASRRDGTLKGALVLPALDGPPETDAAMDPFTNHSAILGALKIFCSSGTGAGIRAVQSSTSPLARSEEHTSELQSP